MPDPIIEPTTIARLIHFPSIREVGSGCVSVAMTWSDIARASHPWSGLAIRTPEPNRAATQGEIHEGISFPGPGQPGSWHGSGVGRGQPNRTRRVRRGRRGAEPEPVPADARGT